MTTGLPGWHCLNVMYHNNITPPPFNTPISKRTPGFLMSDLFSKCEKQLFDTRIIVTVWLYFHCSHYSSSSRWYSYRLKNHICYYLNGSNKNLVHKALKIFIFALENVGLCLKISHTSHECNIHCLSFQICVLYGGHFL